jgi:hypothetical protein
MNKEKVIELLESLQEDVDSWDREDKEIDKLADESIEALEYAVNIIKSSNVVGSLDINGAKYIVSN